ncbi:MAG: PDZ domain-containing protein [Oscillospiraceae bacterium]|nr:PDZ domain-containing protein [Oscillospiraceae bacterium]
MGRRIWTATAALLLMLGLALPAWAQTPEALVPVGRTVGLEMETDGVYISDFDSREQDSPAKAAGLRVGDRILTADGRRLENAEALRALVARSGGAPIILGIRRGDRAMSFTVRPQAAGSSWRLGLYLRDRVAGLGTVTFYDPGTGLFGALGHGVSESDGVLLELRSGRATETAVAEIQRGVSGTPGALLGPTGGGTLIGEILQNTDRGIFGQGIGGLLDGTPVPLAPREEVTPGPAEIWSSVAGAEPERYSVEIEAVRLDNARCRDLRIRVTDPRLLEATGGIVQGMSGSPILQKGKLVGAVTHVLIQDPTRGYGILIGHMLEAAEGQRLRAA